MFKCLVQQNFNLRLQSSQSSEEYLLTRAKSDRDLHRDKIFAEWTFKLSHGVILQTKRNSKKMLLKYDALLFLLLLGLYEISAC